jgi:hypothetical protein
MLLSLESRLLSAPSSFPARGPRERPAKVRDAPAGRGRRTWANGNGGSPGTWEILSSPRKLTRKGYRVTNPRPDAGPRSGGGSETCVVPWYRQTKETKRGGRAGRKSQCLDSTEEAGELVPRGPGGWEARHRVTTPMARNTWEALNSRVVLPQRQRIATHGFAAASCRW